MRLGTLIIKSKTEIMSNNYDAIVANIEQAMKVGMEELAKDLFQGALKGYGSGRPGPQTGAALASFYVISPFDQEITSKHAQALAAAKSLYVGEHITDEGLEFSYDAAHFAERALVEPAVNKTVEPHVIVAGLATPLKYVGWWNAGHYNKFTGSVEYFPMMDRFREQVRSQIRSIARDAIRKNRTTRVKKGGHKL